MVRHEWYKLWHNRRIVGIVLLLVLVNCGYFAYRDSHEEVPAKAFRALQEELQGQSDVEASEHLTQDFEQFRSALYEAESGTIGVAARHTGNIFAEMSLYSAVLREYEDVLTYQSYVKEVVNAPAKFRILQSLFGEGGRELQNVEKTAEDYQNLTDLSLHHTRTRGISRALGLPSVVFLEILLAVLFMSVLFVREKEQDILSLYAVMPKGRCRLMGAKLSAVTFGIIISNLLLLGSTILTGCLLYGAPALPDWTQPLQSLVGYKAASLPVSILTFLLLVYAGSVLVSVFFAVLTAALGIVFNTSRMVYLSLFLLIGAEGILYLKIDDLSYLANWKRINLVAFSDVAGRLGRYHNIYIFGNPVNDWRVALAVLLIAGVLLVSAVAVMVGGGVGLSVRKHGRIRAVGRKTVSDGKNGGTGEGIFRRSAGCHGNIFLHECFKYLRLERIGVIAVLLVLWVVFFTKPYQQGYSVQDMHYRGFLLRLQEAEPSEYAELAAGFRADLEEAKKSSSPGAMQEREDALREIEDYVAYLQPHEGASAVDEKAVSLLYDNRKQNILMGAAALLLVILCATSLYYIEYRTGMAEMIRITAVGRRRVPLWKTILLLASILIIFGLIYGRYLWQVKAGCNLTGIRDAAYSVRDFSGWPARWSVRGVTVLVYLKRLAGLLIASAVAVLMIRKVKSFIFAVVGSVLVMVLPLLLCFFEAKLLDKVLMNWFFL
ncbi:MAG: hypothetical protein J6Y10_05935 [Lachnospiraceae bacterium]|nr:hypothetical protein [Lachnospiraceae bacterium]